jgi:Chaperone of endosialidase
MHHTQIFTRLRPAPLPRPWQRALLVAGLVLALHGAARAGGPPNPTQSDKEGNTAGGTGVLVKNTGRDNTGFGAFALPANTEGESNTAIGNGALFDNIEGSYNTAVGEGALFRSTGHDNTAVGHGALGSLTAGNDNTALGAAAGSSLAAGDDNLYLGNLGPPVSANGKESNTTRVGEESDQTRAFIAGIFGTTASGGTAVFITKDGQLGTRPSAARYKRDIRALGTRSQGLYQLRPVTFRYTHDPEGQRQYGLIAEDVAQVYPELVVRRATGAVEAVQYEELIPLLLNEVQLRQHQLAALHTQNQRLEAALARRQAEQRAQTAALAARLEQLGAAHPVTLGRR